MLRSLLRLVVTAATIVATGVALYLDDRVLGFVITTLTIGLLLAGLAGVVAMIVYVVRAAFRALSGGAETEPAQAAAPLRAQTASGR